MEAFARIASNLFTISPAQWESMKHDTPGLDNIEEYLLDHKTKMRLMAELDRTLIHDRGNLFPQVAKVVRDESHRLKTEQAGLQSVCRSAAAAVDKHLRLRLIMQATDCEMFWKRWSKNLEDQEDFFERAGDNIWLESARMDRLRQLFDEERRILRIFSRVIRTLGTRVERMEPAATKAGSAQTAESMEERWRRFRDVNAQQDWRSPGSLRMDDLTPQQAAMLRDIARDIRSGKVPEKDLKRRFFEFAASIDSA
jgi:hypothetical protein